MWALQFFSTQWSGPACHGRARCHGHGGQIYVAESPWTVKASPEGVVTLDDVPEGAVSVKIWHALQLVEPAPQKLAVGATPAKLTVQVDVVPRRRRL